MFGCLAHRGRGVTVLRVLEPFGPLPRGVYLRRRVAAMVGAALGVVALTWVIGGLLGPEDGDPVRGMAARAPVTSSPPATPEAAPGSSTSPAATGPAGQAGSASATAVTTTTATATTTATGSATTTTPPPDPGLPCPDAAIAVAAETGAPSYPVGRRPLLRLVVTNVGPVPCTRDVGRKVRDLTITTRDGATRVWSSNDCHFGVRAARPQILQPGERLEFGVNWAGRTSTPGCPAQRAKAPPGEYAVVATLGGLAGPPAPLTLTP